MAALGHVVRNGMVQCQCLRPRLFGTTWPKAATSWHGLGTIQLPTQ
jgi:hypothetical protein